MKTILKSVILAGVMIVAAAPQLALADKAQPSAPALSGPVAPGIGIANLEAIVANSSAFKTAQQQRPVTYKSTYDAAEARRQQIGARLQPLIEKFNRERQAPNANQASLQQQAAAIQQIQDSANPEMQNLIAPISLSEAYVQEQINEKLPAAVQNAMSKQKITLLLTPQSVISATAAYNLNQAILTELNTLLPSAQLVPPQGWEPREAREARAAQQAQGAAAPARPAGSQTDGR